MSGKHGTHRKPDDSDSGSEAKHKKSEDEEQPKQPSDPDEIRRQFEEYASNIHPGNR